MCNQNVAIRFVIISVAIAAQVTSAATSEGTEKKGELLNSTIREITKVEDPKGQDNKSGLEKKIDEITEKPDPTSDTSDRNKISESTGLSKHDSKEIKADTNATVTNEDASVLKNKAGIPKSNSERSDNNTNIFSKDLKNSVAFQNEKNRQNNEKYENMSQSSESGNGNASRSPACDNVPLTTPSRPLQSKIMAQLLVNSNKLKGGFRRGWDGVKSVGTGFGDVASSVFGFLGGSAYDVGQSVWRGKRRIKLTGKEMQH